MGISSILSDIKNDRNSNNKNLKDKVCILANLDIIVIQDNLEDLLNRRNYVGVIFSLYFDEGVLKSTDGTLNWRLDIWQDLLKDQKQQNKLIFGAGILLFPFFR